MSKKPSDFLKKQIDLQLQYSTVVQQEYGFRFQESLSQLSNIRQMLSNNGIRIKFGGADTKAEIPVTEHASSVEHESDSQEKKKAGKPKKVKKKTCSVVEDSDAVLSDISTSSNRSQRAAAEAAGRKLAEVQNFMKATKLRRPTDFDERQRKRDKTSSPPAKSRKTYKKQSAGSQSSIEISDSENKENVHSDSETHLMDRNLAKFVPIECVDFCLKNKCIVSLAKLTNSAIKSQVRRSGSLESILHKNTSNGRGVSENINLKKSNKTLGNEELVMSTEDMFGVLVDSKCSLVEKSPLSEGQFKGFDLDNTEACKEVIVISENCNEECEIDSPERKIDSRTKVIKKPNVVSENKFQSPTKTIKNKSMCLATMSNEECEIDSPERKIDSRTKVIKKHNDVSEKNEECNVLSSQQTKLMSEASSSSGSPIAPKGLVVKKRVEEFENLGKNVKETTGVITRLKNRNLLSRAVTPVNAAHNVNIKLNSATTPVQVEHTVALVQKQPQEEPEKKKKEEERLKRQAKEETAIKRKEKTLKATVEEIKRKREEKLKKAAAMREAAEKEKYMLILKAEREKEVKMLQKAAENEKLKQEYLKMKQLSKQKVLEHEERRKREEEARLARLKEQEEEHKRILAMRERELELKKLAKKNEIRLAESEKAKHKNLKLCKAASGTSGSAKVQHVNPTSQEVQACLSYELTPAREDRPLLEPKSENDYGIDHTNSGDSSEDESQPKKKIPQWADAKVRHRLLKVNSHLPREIWPSFMDCSAKPDVNQIFAGNPIRKRVRTSSAVWDTPPHK